MVGLMHLLQAALWFDPGPCYGLFDEKQIGIPPISVAEILILDFNAVVSSGKFRKSMIAVLLQIVKWV